MTRARDRSNEPEEQDTVRHAVSLFRSLADRLEAAPTAAEAEAILREAVGSVDRMRERMY